MIQTFVLYINLNGTIKCIFQKNEYIFIFDELYQCQNITKKKICKSQKEKLIAI